MFKAGKIWGETELILANNALEFHRIDYKKGDFTVIKPNAEHHVANLGYQNRYTLQVTGFAEKGTF